MAGKKRLEGSQHRRDEMKVSAVVRNSDGTGYIKKDSTRVNDLFGKASHYIFGPGERQHVDDVVFYGKEKSDDDEDDERRKKKVQLNQRPAPHTFSFRGCYQSSIYATHSS